MAKGSASPHPSAREQLEQLDENMLARPLALLAESKKRDTRANQRANRSVIVPIGGSGTRSAKGSSRAYSEPANITTERETRGTVPRRGEVLGMVT